MTQHNNTWKEVQLGNHVDLLTGYPFKSKQFTQDDNDIRLLRGDNVAQGFLRWNDAKRWPREEYEAYSSCHLQKGDVILAMDRPWISAGLKYAWIKEGDLPCLLVQRVARLRGTDGLLTDYLRYVIGSHDFTNHVLSITTGVNVPHISGRDIKAFRFKLPPEPVQERVVSILSAYDDLIENNTRRIEILEEMARRLYEEWFVHFRFPGHEEVNFKESELGEIPEGWWTEAATDAFKIKYGKTFPKKNLDPNGQYPVFGGGGVIGRCDQFNIDGPTTLITSRGNGSGTVWRAPEAGLVTNNAFTVMPKDSELNTHFGYIEQVMLNAPVMSVVGGAAQPQLTLDGLSGVRVMTPDPKVVDQFSLLVDPLYILVNRLQRKNSNLRAQRDLLLPKLVSGEIDVSDIPMPDDKEVEAA